MQADRPKQYLPLLGKTVLECTLDGLLSHAAVAHVYMPVAADDKCWSTLSAGYYGRVSAVAGGASRADSVLNALRSLQSFADPRDWLLVHDVARPCLRHADLDKLLSGLQDSAVGGLLGGPAADTMKRTASDGLVTETVSRDNLWRAYTPQMFRFGLLMKALEGALAAGVLITDEASAIEFAGLRPQMIRGQDDNIKLTYPRDLELAALFLQRILKEENRQS